MSYTLNELVASTSLSRRTIYYYMGRGLLPQVGRGRGARYSETHLWRLMLIRALTELGVPLDLIQRHLRELSLERVKLLVAPLLPLDDLNAQLQGEIHEIRKTLEPSVELDIGNMGLEDPMALRHRLSGLEDHLIRIELEQTKAREVLYRILVAAEDGDGEGKTRTVEGIQDEPASASQLGDVVARLERLCGLLKAPLPGPDERGKRVLSSFVTQGGSLTVVIMPNDGPNGERPRKTSGALKDLADRITQAVAVWENEHSRERQS